MADISTTATLAAQWSNPANFLSLLMIIGGPVIQVALAQVTGTKFVPICFSFGWISYVFSMVPALAGDGRLMPTPDYACKVINLETGYARTNRSWVIGRLLRDLEATKYPETNVALRVVVYKAEKFKGRHHIPLSCGKSSWLSIVGILCQLAISFVPFVLKRDWAIPVITMGGTILCLATAALPQWRVEKLACRNASTKKIAITVGNGSRHVIVILGEGNCFDLEDLSGSEGPRQARPWMKWGWFALPTDIWVTRVFWMVSIVLWSILLLSVVALKANAWFLILIGTIGMVQNTFIAAVQRDPETRGLKLAEDIDLIGAKVMDVLMDLETWEPGCGKPLLKEFFPGDLDMPEDRGEKQWWDATTGKERDPETEHNVGIEQGINKDEPPAERKGVEDSRRKYDDKRYADEYKGKRFDLDDNVEIKSGKTTRGKTGGIKRPKPTDEEAKSNVG